ncbi:MAG: hypothetical protein EOO71_19095 [Myxococcaceae bacterium]|nr:MAG: hypothetical protein EOO71_19095 [Myxococcaceae bacterium]
MGVCVECRRVICRECTTQFEGINRCASCLDTRRKALEGPPPRREWSVVNVVLALVGAVLLWGGVVLAAHVAG